MLNKLTIGYSLWVLVIATLFIIDFASAAGAETAGWRDLTESCKQKMFPIRSGGSEDEYVTCTVFDEKNEWIIVAGNTTSDDYGPSAAEHAFIYALDTQGNWQWGKYYYQN